MIEGFEMEKESSTGRLRVALVGAEKNGKSVLASTAIGNKLFLDFDQRREAVAGKKGVYAITLKDPQYPKMPEVAEDVLDIMTKLEASLDLYNLTDRKGNRLIKDVKPETSVENLIFDSMSSFAKCQIDYETYNNPDLCRKIKVGPNYEVRIPSGWDAWNAEKDTVGAVIMRAFALPINVFCTFHEAAEKANDSTAKEPKYTGRISIYPANLKALLKYFNEVWRVKLTPINDKTGQRYLPRVYPLPDYSFDSATTMLLDPIEEPNIEAMIAKHKLRSFAQVRQASVIQVPAIAGVSK